MPQDMFGKRENQTEIGLQRTRDTWFSRVRRLFSGPSLNDETWEELEEVLLQADVGLAATEKLLSRVRARVQKEGIYDPETARQVLQDEVVRLFPSATPSAPSAVPWVILMAGVNGAGKTTSIAKLTHLFRKGGKTVLLAAADTFRAAAIDQLRIWGERAGAEVIAHQSGGDPAAVVFDALEAARHRGVDIVIIDTAGRLHTKYNLMEELKKIRRVAQKQDPQAPHEVLLVMDATTGQNGLAQARAFTAAIGVDGIFLAKLDGTAKGGIALAIADELGIPLRYLGTGETLDDIVPFDAQAFAEALFR